MNDDELDDRFLSDGTLAALRDYWKLESFLAAEKGRREAYYDFIDGQIAVFTRARRPPNDGCLRDVVVLMLKGDRSYRVFLKEAGADEELLEDGPWDNLLAAGAGAVLCQFARDRER